MWNNQKYKFYRFYEQLNYFAPILGQKTVELCILIDQLVRFFGNFVGGFAVQST